MEGMSQFKVVEMVPSKETVISSLREGNTSHLIAWLDAKEAQIGTKGNAEGQRANVELQIEIADIYTSAGVYDQAKETLEEIFEMGVLDHGDEDLQDKVRTLLDRIQGSSGVK